MRLAVLAAVLLALYVVIAYVVMPAWWNRYASRHPSLDGVPGITQTASGIPGDPLNVALVGSQAEAEAAMAAAGWSPADPLSVRSDLKIAADTVLERAYPDAPVSNLFLFGRKEDLAFEQQVAGNPRQRHHVRFWKAPGPAPDGRTVWVGAATFDTHVGLSRTTGQITHHIAADVDAERDHLMQSLNRAGRLTEVFRLDGFHAIHEGRNGGGDPWRTDGALSMGVISPAQPVSPRN